MTKQAAVHVAGFAPLTRDRGRIAPLDVMAGAQHVEFFPHACGHRTSRERRYAPLYILIAERSVVVERPPCRRREKIGTSTIG